MTHKTLNTRHALESCTYQLHNWKPFTLQTLTKTLDSETYTVATNASFHRKKPCLSDRATAPHPIENLDMSKLTLIDDEKTPKPHPSRESIRWFARKRRRRGGSRSVSGRSSGGDRSCARLSATYATCSDFPVAAAAGTDSSGELFGDSNWGSDVGEARNGGGGGERESIVCGTWHGGVCDLQGNESGYGSEPGYRGDVEFGYGDEFDEEEDDGRPLFWGERFGGADVMETVGENTFSEQKVHHRCRRKKHEWRMVAPLR